MGIVLKEVSLTQALRDARSLGLDRLDAQLLMLHALGKPQAERAWLTAHDDEILEAAVAEDFHRLSQRRSAGEPLAYIVGYKEFFGIELMVDSRVLVPRPDTETLVQWALDVLAEYADTSSASVLDLGTGSGAIALAIAKTLHSKGKACVITASDASADALEVARGNAQKLGLAVAFIQSSWFTKVSTRHHLIVSNPPYIADADPHLAALVHEPVGALTAGSDGLDDIRQIIADAPLHLENGGWLLLEHGYDQSRAVQDLMRQAGLKNVQGRADLAGIARCTGGQRLADAKNQTAG